LGVGLHYHPTSPFRPLRSATRHADISCRRRPRPGGVLASGASVAADLGVGIGIGIGIEHAAGVGAERGGGRGGSGTTCGPDKDIAALPWLWSEQYGLKLKIAGLHANHDDIVLNL
jgi:3-phenylpropionate/trans-cinnamate dioxygenase ferredoxin reductase subunit